MGEEGTRIMTPAERRDLDHRLYESGLPDLGIFPGLSSPYLPEGKPELRSSWLSRLGVVVLRILCACVCILLIPFVWFIAKECDHND
jgi:hypothetical protein